MHLTGCLACCRYVGDTRAAIVPFLAHKQLGDTYKWLLYGDDDTVWFMDGVLDVLSDLDPDTPYFISGQLHAQLVPCGQRPLSTPGQLRAQLGLDDSRRCWLDVHGVGLTFDQGCVFESQAEFLSDLDPDSPHSISGQLVALRPRP